MESTKRASLDHLVAGALADAAPTTEALDLFRERLAIVAAARGICLPEHINVLAAEVQRVMTWTTVNALECLREAGVVAAPLRLTDRLLWSEPPASQVQAKDIDLLVDHGRSEIAFHCLRLRFGALPLTAIDYGSGAAQVVEDNSRHETESEKGGKWPLSFFVPIASLRVFRRELVPNLDVLWPLIAINGEVGVQVRINLYYALWPMLSFERVTLGRRSWGHLVFYRVRLADQVVSWSIRLADGIATGKPGLVGTALSLAELLLLSSTWMAEINERAKQLGLSEQYNRSLRTLQTFGRQFRVPLPV